ncbi:rho GTPase-activating protein 23-like isoform X2 [Nerophis ophidion]|uniref:rho GTPase-activating protein 23-like isoform X2 n=1 Tax=Nerophis ophidion TaxID=159077 RepID=UPI002AE05A30|nr:rho GTPase-activating protein 23-like isoform X2 [Nerophis ophidion]
MHRLWCIPPAPSGKKWCFQCSVGVDCRDAEPRCIWLAVLRMISPPASPSQVGSVRIRRVSLAEGRKDNMVSYNQNRRRPLSCGELEGPSWCGLRTVDLHKNLQGFGFTLRHFLVYPPESSFQNIKVEDNGNAVKKCGQQFGLEPMDTIFVKSVKENGPAYRAGLCTGDRLVKVNGENILGKTYSQVIALIKNSETRLELSVVQKDEDVLQLVHSQDAYLRGNESYSDEAKDIPETLFQYCFSTSPKSNPSQPRHKLSSPLDNWEHRPCPTTSPMDHHLSIASPEDACSNVFTSVSPLGNASLAISALDFHIANHYAAIASATLPPRRKSSLSAPGDVHIDSFCHQGLSDFQAEVYEHLSPRKWSTHQDCLAEQDLGTRPPSASAQRNLRESLFCHHQADAVSNRSYWLRDWGGLRPGRTSCSESLLSAYAEYEHNYDRSIETLAKASAVITSSPDHSLENSHVTRICERLEHQSPENFLSCTVSPCGKQAGQQEAEPQTRGLRNEVMVHKNGLLLQPVLALREPYNMDPHSSLSPEIRSNASANKVGVVMRPKSTPNRPVSEGRAQTGHDRDVISMISLNQDVLKNNKNPATTLNPRSLESPSPVSVGPCASRRTKGSLAQQAYDSLSSIPFLGSIKRRRSSYLLAITTERSKSCDEGLNTFREEGHVLSKLPKRVKSFFINESLESLKAQEEARSKHHSTSELGTIHFSNTRVEGWLHYKQILTEKGKKVGGGIRPWKRVFSVLRPHWVFLYKDKREAVLHGEVAGPGPDEYPPISICGCLVDIAYSETKRKHALRLTTQNFCEYLLQAESREDMLAWIKLIRENSKMDNEDVGSSRQALINKKLNDYRKHSFSGNQPDSSPGSHRGIPPFLLAKTENTTVNASFKTDDNKAPWGISIMKKSKKTSSPKAFGVRLEDCQPAVNHKFVPQVVEMCCGVVEATGLESTGIYRVPGNNAMVSNLQDHLNKGFDINTAKERWQDLNVISSLLKSFFRKLPQPLFTDDKYQSFIDANRIEDTRDRLKTMKKLIHDLPDYHRHTLKFLVAHLKKVADHSEKNKMEPRNLALVFGPTLVRTSEDNMTDMVTHMPDRYKIVETLILHYGWFFPEEEREEQGKPPDDKRDMQPVPKIDHLLCNIGRQGMPGEASVDPLLRRRHQRFS